MADRAATIARKSSEDELSIKTKQYNQGLIGNEEMRAFLQELSKNSQLTGSEKADIDLKIKDFDNRIYVSRAEAVYKNTPDNTLQRVQAAQTLSNYYSEQAATMAPGTPAQSEILEKAAQWNQVALSEKNNVERNARSLQRAQLFRNAANLEPGSIDEALAKADSYARLAEQARIDGDETQALQFETQSQNEYNRIPIIQERMAREAESGERQVKSQQKTAVMNYINEAQNLYERGKISPDEMFARLEEADKAAVEIGDTSIQYRLTNIAQRVNRDVERGVTYSEDGTFGSVSRGGGGGGSGELVYDPTTGVLSLGGSISKSTTGTRITSGGVGGNKPVAKATGSPMSLSELAEDYKANIKKIHQWFTEGATPDGKPFGAKEYTTTLAVLSQARTADLQNIVSNLSSVSPNAKVMFEGRKTQVRDILTKFEKELEDVSVESNQLQKGDVVPVMTYSNSGTIKGRPVVELRSRDQIGDLDSNYVQDSQGVYHQLRQDKMTFKNAKEFQDYIKKNPQAAADSDMTTLSAKGGKYLNVTDEAGNTIRYEYNPQYGYIPKIVGNPQDPKDNIAQNLKKLQDVIIKEAEDARVSGKPFKARAPLTPSGLQSFIESGEGDKILAPSLNLQVKPPTFMEQVQDTGNLIKQDIQKVKDLNFGKEVVNGQEVIKPFKPGTVGRDALDSAVDAVKDVGSKVVGAVSNFPGRVENDVWKPFAEPATQTIKPGPIPVVKATPQAVKAVQAVQQKPAMKALEPPKPAQQSAQLKMPPKAQPNIIEQAKKTIKSLGQKLLPSFFK